MPLSPSEINEIAERMSVLLRDSTRWDAETHTRDHAWVRRQLKREAERAALRKKIITSACIWAVPILLGFAASAFWRELVRQLRAASQ